MFISQEAGQLSYNLLSAFINKNTNFPFKYQNFPANTNIFHEAYYPFFATIVRIA